MSPMMKKKNLFFSKMSIAEEQNDFPLHFAWNMLLDRHIFRNFRPKFPNPTITRPGQMWAIPEMPEVAARVATSGSFRRA